MIEVQVSLSDLDEQIQSYDNLITYQKNEIIKTQALIDNFQDCLLQQNEALKTFIDEKEKLVAEKVKRYESCSLIIYDTPLKNNVGNPRFDLKYAPKKIEDEKAPKIDTPKKIEDEKSLKIDTPKKIEEKKALKIDTPKKIEEKKALKIDTPKKIEYNTDNKKRISNGDNGCVMKKIRCLSSTNRNIIIDPLHISAIKDKIVHKILVYGNDIYIGGSEGLLLRHTPEYTHIYETNTDDDILQIEITEEDKSPSINVFTQTKIITYEDVAWYTKRKEVYIPEIGTVFFDGEHLFIPFKMGLIKRLSANELKKAPFVTDQVRSFVPCPSPSKLALLSLKDQLLYTTSKTEPHHFRLVRGPTKIVGIKRMGYYFLCHSTRKFWLLNSSFQIIYQLDIKERIVLVDVSDSAVVVIDGSNNVHLYSLIKDRCLEPKIIYREKISGEITSLSFANNTVYLAVGHDIVTIKYNYNNN